MTWFASNYTIFKICSDSLCIVYLYIIYKKTINNICEDKKVLIPYAMFSMGEKKTNLWFRRKTTQLGDCHGNLIG